MHPHLHPRARGALLLFLAGAALVLPQVYQTASRCLRPMGGSGRAVAFSGGPPSQRTGAPGDAGTCNTSGCHSGSSTNGGSGQLLLTGLPASYTPGQSITGLQLTLQDPTASRWGFQLVAKTAQGAVAGTLVPENTSFAQTNSEGYLGHISGGTFSATTSEASWTFRWTAPAAGAGTVTFYAAGNAANNNGSSSGDKIYTLISPPTVAEGSSADTTPPVFAAGAVSEGDAADLDFAPTATSLTVNWQTATDGESSVVGYSVSLGLSPGASGVAASASATATSHTFTGLSLTHGQKVYATVRAENSAGLKTTALGDGLTLLAVNHRCNVDDALGTDRFDPDTSDLSALLDIVLSGSDPLGRCALGRCNFDGQQPTGSASPDVGDVAKLLSVIVNQTGLSDTCGL